MKKKLVIIVAFGVFLLIQPIGAQTWTAAKRLTWNPGLSGRAQIAVDSNNYIHVVWHDDSPGNYEIYYKMSTNGGTTWSIRRLTYNAGSSRVPQIAVDSSSNIHVVWMDDTSGNNEIYYKKSTNGGTTWSTRRFTYNPGNSVSPAIVADSNNYIHVVWSDNTTQWPEIYYKKSTDGGVSWTTKRLTYKSSISVMPAIAVDSNNYIHVVWCDTSSGDGNIYYKKSVDGGTSWTTKRLTNNSGSSQSPKIAVDSNNYIHVVWHDYTPGNFEIYYKRSTDGGASWTTKRLTWNSEPSALPSISIDSMDYIHIVWLDDTPGNGEIFYKRSTNGGGTWTAKRLTYNPGTSSSPAITVDSNNHIHVTWTDETPGNYEIHYKKGIQ